MSLTRLMLRSAVSIYEAEGALILELLSKQKDRLLFDAFSTIGAVLVKGSN